MRITISQHLDTLWILGAKVLTYNHNNLGIGVRNPIKGLPEFKGQASRCSFGKVLHLSNSVKGGGSFKYKD